MPITEQDASVIKGMLERGDKQHNIAAFFGVNSGRVAEIRTGVRFPDVQPAAKHQLPPASALAGGIAVHQARTALSRVARAIAAARAALDDYAQKPGSK